MNSVKLFFKKNYSYGIFLIFLIAVFWVHMNTSLYRIDDVMYYVASKSSINNMFRFLKWHYYNQNGRIIVHFLDVLFLRNDALIWRFSNTLTFGSTVFLSAKIIESEKFSFDKSLIISTLLYSLLDYEITRTSVYWISASLNYMFPMTIVLLIGYLSKKEKYNFGFVLLSLLAGMTMEQPAMITIGLLFLLIMKSIFFDKKKPNVYLLVSFVFSVIGFLTVLLSPADKTRYEETKTPVGLRTYFNKFYNDHLFSNWINLKTIVFVTALSFSVAIMLFYIYKHSSKNKRLYGVASYGMFILTTARLFMDVFDLKIKVIYTITILLFTFSLIFFTVYTAVYFLAVYKSFLPIIAVILGIGSQIMLVVVSKSSTRVMYPGVVCFMIYALYAFSISYKLINKTIKNIAIVIMAVVGILLITKSICSIKMETDYVSIPKGYVASDEMFNFILNNDWYSKENMDIVVSFFS